MFKKKIKKLLETGCADPEKNMTLRNVPDGMVTNQSLMHDLVDTFRSELRELSVGRRMIYPMSFNVLMHPDDYNAREGSFPFVLPEVVSAFYSVIEDEKEDFPIYTPPAKYWFFQFSACVLCQSPTKDEIMIVQKGQLTILSSLLSFDIKDTANITEEAKPRVSIRLQDSSVNGANINWDAIKGGDIVGKGTFKYRFDESLTQDSQKIITDSNIAETDGLATLSYSYGGKNIHFLMQDDLVNISGRNDLRRGRSILKLESDQVLDSHLQIKYLSKESKFQIATYGQARLNERNLDISEGGNVLWYDLADKSRIFLSEALINIEFDIKKHR